MEAFFMSGSAMDASALAGQQAVQPSS